MQKIFAVLALALVIHTGHAANTISSTNVAWRTNVTADADLFLAENTNRPSPFKTIAVTIANLFSNRTARGTWDFATATVSGLSSFSFVTNVFTNGFWSGYVVAQGRTGATNHAFVWRETNGTALLEFRTNKTIMPTTTAQIYVGTNGASLAELWANKVAIGVAGNGDVGLTPNGNIGYLNFSRLDGSSSAGITMDGYNGARLVMPQSGSGSFAMAYNNVLNRLLAAGVDLTYTNGIMFHSYYKSGSIQALTTPDAGLRAWSNSTVMLYGTNQSGIVAPTATGSLLASNVNLTGRLDVSGVIAQSAVQSNYYGLNYAPLTVTTAISYTPNIYYTNTLGRLYLSVPLSAYCPPSADCTATIRVDTNSDGTPDYDIELFFLGVGTTAGSIRQDRTLHVWLNQGQAWGVNISTNSGAAISSTIYHRTQF